MPTSALVAALRCVTQHPPIAFRNVAMVPLIQEVDRARPRGGRGHGRPAPGPLSGLSYLTLDNAIPPGWLEIREVSGQGSVPELLALNRAPQPVLIVDGEELIGARQDRIVNLTILVPALATLVIPVSCVEAGRWMEAIYSTHGGSIERYVEALAPVDHQVGAVFLVNGRIAGFDLFDRPSTLRAILPKLVRAVAVDALDADGSHGAAHDETAAASLSRLFLGTVADAAVHVTPALGLGDDVRLTGPGITGAALVVHGTVIHACAFAP